MTSLELKQIFFAVNLAKFILEARTYGYYATFGEAWRSPETCALYAKEGKGIANSVHPLRLACDLNWWFQGELVETPEMIAELWQSYSTNIYKCCAGYFFVPNKDADHFSVFHEGVK